MDLGPLLYFVTVAEQRSFTRAAELLHVSQPTISKLVRNLEDELGVPLFDRSGKHVALTDAGEAALVQARQILQSVHDLTAGLGQLKSLERGTLQIGLPPMVGAPFFARVIAEFHARHPNIALSVYESGAQRVEQAVAAGELDLGAVLLPVDQQVFETFPFVREPVLLAVHPQHRLAEQETASVADLRDEPFILFREDFALHHRIKQACAREGFQPRVVCESSQWDFIGEMVAADIGLALLPQPICRRLDPNRIRTVRLDPPGLAWDLALAWRKDRYLSYAARAWVEVARSLL